MDAEHSQTPNLETLSSVCSHPPEPNTPKPSSLGTRERFGVSRTHSLRRFQELDSCFNASFHRLNLNLLMAPRDKFTAVLQVLLWLAVRPFGNVRGETLQNEFADEIRYCISADSGQTIEDD
jgi:hypothetical protein